MLSAKLGMSPITWPPVYHHHMGQVVRYQHERDALMANSGDGIPRLLDAGHLAFAEGDPMAAIDAHHARMAHVHTKDIGREVINALDLSGDSFLDAVLKHPALNMNRLFAAFRLRLKREKRCRCLRLKAGRYKGGVHCAW